MNRTYPPQDVGEAWLQGLMTRHGTSVLRLCYGYLKDANLAEDAAQDTFLKAWKKRAQASQIQAERAWIMRIAVNVCKDMLRSAWFRHEDRRTELIAALQEEKPYPLSSKA